MKIRGLVSALLVLAAGTAAAAEPPLTNEDLITMVRAGISSATIIEKINASATDFRLDVGSLADLASNGVPDEVIRAMFARQNADVGPTGLGWREADAKKVWPDLMRVAGRGRAAGKVLLFEQGVQFAVGEDTAFCTDTGMGFALTWDRVAAVCFKYVVSEGWAVGTLIIRTKAGNSYQLRGSQLTVQAMEGEFKWQQSRLDYRCD